MRSKTILITGSAGFIGSSLSERLINDNKIIGVDCFTDDYPIVLKEKNIQNLINKNNFKFYRTDICDKNEMEKIFSQNKIDVVIHIAAKAGVRKSILKPLEYVKTNIEGTVNILNLMQKYDIKKLIFASSSSVYGNSTADKFSEDIKISEPISPYAATKSACEQFIYTYSKIYNIQAVCLRFFTVYGPKQRPDLAIRKFIELIEDNKPIDMYGDGSTYRDYTYIDDIIDGICSAIEYNQTPYEVINLGGGRTVTLKEMISVIENTLNKKAIINELPMQKGDVNRTIADISKAQRLLNYNPKVKFEEGIKKFIEWEKINRSIL